MNEVNEILLRRKHLVMLEKNPNKCETTKTEKVSTNEVYDLWELTRISNIEEHSEERPCRQEFGGGHAAVSWISRFDLPPGQPLAVSA